MNGDFTRLTFRPERHFSGVRLQQGRVLLDADWNEQADIVAHRDRTAAADAFGAGGAPLHEAGFRLVPVAGTESTWGGAAGVIGRGRYYVNGTVCVNDTDVVFGSQPDLLGATLPATAGAYLVYLDVWQRHLTALEDPGLREVALGGPDTTTREKTVWQVKLERVAGAGEEVSCAPFREGWSPANTRSTGRLRARAQPSPPTADECLVPPGAGFQRLENQLYRVEIHTPAPGTPAGGAPATFKWSRENASVAARVERIQETVITVFDPARDPTLGFGPGQLVELTDLQRTLSGQPGALVQLESAQGPTMTVREWPGGAPPVLGAEPVVRRWESPAALPVTPGTPTAPSWVDLEDGVQVEFIGDEFRTGDYWLIPARTLTGTVEWPQVGGQPLFERRHGTAHHYAPLAILDFDGATWTIRHDCRRLFPPTTELIQLHYAGGGGQDAIPDPDPARAGRFLPLAEPLRVRVTNGEWPVQGAAVVFRIAVSGASTPGGQLTAVVGQGTAPGVEVSVRTDAEGMAACSWALDERFQSQRVVAHLRTEDGERSPITFDGQLSRAAAVAYAPGECSLLQDVSTVQRAIDLLCLRGSGSEPGIHVRAVTLASGAELSNDSNVAARALASGFNVACAFDEGVARALNPASVNPATCYLTLDVPFPFNQADTQRWNTTQIVGFQPLVLDGQVSATADTISWRPSAATATWLTDRLFQTIGTARERLLARLTLKGNFITSGGGAEPVSYLDGDSFGIPGRDRTGSAFPSGDGRRGGDFDLWFWLFPRAELENVTITPPEVVGGTATRPRLTLRLSVPSQAGVDVQIALEGDVPPGVVTIPNTARIQQGQQEVSVEIGTAPVASQVRLLVRVTMGQESRAASLTINPPVAIRLRPARDPILLGDEVDVVLTLNGPAPAGGTPIRVSGAAPAVLSFPGSPNNTVVVPAGAQEATFRVASNPAARTVSQDTLSATPTLGDQPAQVVVNIRRLTLSAPALSPTQVIGGGLSTATVTLSDPAPSRGAVLGLVVNGRLRYEDAQGNVITSVNVPAGARNATFRVRPEGVLLSTNVPVTVTEQVSAVSVSSTLTVLPSVFSGGVVLQPTTVASGNRSNGTLNLNGPAPREGAVANLRANPNIVGFLNAGGQTVSSVVFPAAGQTVGFQVTTPSLGFNETQTVTVVAEMAVSGFTTTAQLTIRGPAKPPKEKDKNEKAEIKERGEKVQLEKALPQENIAVQPSPRLGGGINFGALPEATDEGSRAGPGAPEAPLPEAEGRAFIPPEGRDSGETASVAALSEPLPEPPPEPAPEPPPTAPASRPRSRRRTSAGAAAPAPEPTDVPAPPAARSRSRRRTPAAAAPEAAPLPEAPAPRPRSRRRSPAAAAPEAAPPEAQPEAPPPAEGGRARRRRRST